MVKKQFFCICPNCGDCNWIETIRNDIGTTERVNELTREGEMRYPWKIDVYIHNKFSEMKTFEKKFYQQKDWFSETYDDLICFNCEKRLNAIPFSDINKEKRILIFKMNSKDRIDFSRNYIMVKKLEEKDYGTET